jgi:3'-phosphoadenosine 5'-phosphosulfate sulfotransferase (PAPS reductase)/FAD synthetase
VTGDTVHILSVSGGKDSTAAALHLREQGIPFRAVHFDTGWEHAATVEYVRNTLPGIIGQPVEVASREPKQLDERREAWAVELEVMLGFRSPMVRWILSRGMFPSRVRRFCTQELKVFTARDVMREAHARGELPINVVGIRAAESAARARLEERELSTTLDCMVWRPLLRWTEADVIAIHRRHGVAPNPLYLRGATRVGCWPCIMAGKAELRLLAKDEPRIRVMERLEEVVGILATERHERREAAADGDTDDGGAFRIPWFFQGNRNHRAPGSAAIPTVPIRQHIAWAQTERGGKALDQSHRQMSLAGLDDGCLRWGMCEVPGDR